VFNLTNKQKVEWVLRIGVAGEFIGHGVFALQQKPSWIVYFTSIGMTEPMALTLLPLIGLFRYSGRFDYINKAS